MEFFHYFDQVYAINSRQTFDSLVQIKEEILRVKDKETVPMVLVGNKKDLENLREVSSTEGAQLARAFGCPFYESSAKARVNVDECFIDLVRAIRKCSPGEHPPNCKCSKHKKKKGLFYKVRCVHV